MPHALQGLTPQRLSELFSLSLADARRVHASVQRDEPLGTQPENVRKDAIRRIAAESCIPSLELAAEQSSALDPFVKYALRTSDAHLIETVRIPLEREGRYSVCVSSQSGCPPTCTFCATGQMKFGRNLTASEILDQTLHFRRIEDVDHCVFMGMGEPMMNLDEVLNK